MAGMITLILIGLLRRECFDHIVVLNETHLRRLLSGYLVYYHGARTHLSLRARGSTRGVLSEPRPVPDERPQPGPPNTWMG